MSVFATPAAATPFPPPPDRGSPSREARGVAPCASVVRRVGRLVLSFSLSLALSHRALATSLFLFLAPHAFPDFSPPRASRDSPVSAGTSRDGDLGRKLGSLHPPFSFLLGLSLSFSLLLSSSCSPSFAFIFLPLSRPLLFGLSLSLPFSFSWVVCFTSRPAPSFSIAPSRPRRTRSDLTTGRPTINPRLLPLFSVLLYSFAILETRIRYGDAPPTAANSPKRLSRRLRLPDSKLLYPPAQQMIRGTPRAHRTRFIRRSPQRNAIILGKFR